MHVYALPTCAVRGIIAKTISKYTCATLGNLLLEIFQNKSVYYQYNRFFIASISVQKGVTHSWKK